MEAVLFLFMCVGNRFLIQINYGYLRFDIGDSKDISVIWSIIQGKLKTNKAMVIQRPWAPFENKFRDSGPPPPPPPRSSKAMPRKPSKTQDGPRPHVKATAVAPNPNPAQEC
jgi:hypothetical protein